MCRLFATGGTILRYGSEFGGRGIAGRAEPSCAAGALTS